MLIFLLNINLFGEKMDIIIDKKIYTERPSKKRSDCEEVTYNTLEMLGIAFERIDHSPADTIEKCHKIEKYINAPICKNLFLTNRTGTVFCLLLMSGDKKYEAGKVSRQLGSSRLSFASDELMMKHLGLTPGSVSITGLLNDGNNCVTLAVDSDLLKNEFFCCHPCINTSTLKLKTSDIIDKFIPYTKHQMKIIDLQSERNIIP